MLRMLSMATLSLGLLGFAGCDVTKTEEGEAPDVDVQVDPGRLPDYEVDAPEVDVTTEEQEVTVPDVDVDIDEETTTIPVPQIDIIPADEDSD